MVRLGRGGILLDEVKLERRERWLQFCFSEICMDVVLFATRSTNGGMTLMDEEFSYENSDFGR